MYNRYVGNTGKYIRVDDEPVIVENAEVREPADIRERSAPRREERAAEPFKMPNAVSGLSKLLGGGGGLFGGGKGLGFLDNVLPFGMDTGDLVLIVLFFFLYLESGDDEFLIIMAFLGYSIFKDRKK